MPIIAFVSSKGGVGKTTASLLTALGLADGPEDGPPRQVVLIDADPNLPLVRWAGLPGKPDNISVLPAPTDEALTIAVRKARFSMPGGQPPDWIVIDTEGGARRAMHMAIRLADFVITPCGPSTIEAVEALKVIGYVREASRTLKRPIRHGCVLTRIPAAIRPRSVKSVVDQLKAAGVPLVPTPLIEKEAFRALFAEGGGLSAMDPKVVSGIASARSNLQFFAADVEQMVLAPQAVEAAE
jgi:chromosome partitioning protein